MSCDANLWKFMHDVQLLRERERFGGKVGCILCKLVFFFRATKDWLTSDRSRDWTRSMGRKMWWVVKFLEGDEVKSHKMWVGFGWVPGTWSLEVDAATSSMLLGMLHSMSHNMPHESWATFVTQTKSRSLKSANQNFMTPSGNPGNHDQTRETSARNKRKTVPNGWRFCAGSGSQSTKNYRDKTRGYSNCQQTCQLAIILQ